MGLLCGRWIHRRNSLGRAPGGVSLCLPTAAKRFDKLDCGLKFLPQQLTAYALVGQKSALRLQDVEEVNRALFVLLLA